MPQVAYNSSIITNVIKSWSKKWAKNVARLEKTSVHMVSVNKPKGKS